MNLKSETNKCLDDLSASVVEFPWEEKNAYAHWLGQTYYYVSHSTRLLSLAASRFEDQALHNRFVEHLREERGHEKMAVNDLKALRYSLGDIPCFPETHAFYMTQYYYLEHTHPSAFFGWILCLEGLAVREGRSLLHRVTAAHGEKAAVFLKVHAEEDVSHLEKAFQAISGLPTQTHGKIIENMRNSAALYADALKRCAKAAPAGQLAA